MLLDAVSGGRGVHSGPTPTLRDKLSYIRRRITFYTSLGGVGFSPPPLLTPGARRGAGLRVHCSLEPRSCFVLKGLPELNVS